MGPRAADRHQAEAAAEAARVAKQDEERVRALQAEAQRLQKQEEERARLQKLQEEETERTEQLIREETERRVREETEKLMQVEMERLVQEETERIAREEAEAELRQMAKEEERKRHVEAERVEAERKETERRAKEEDEKREKEAAERSASEEAARKAKEEEERKTREEAAKREADRKAKEEGDKKAEAAKRAKEEAEAKAKEESEKKASEKRAKEEAKAREKAEKEAEKKAKEEERAREKALKKEGKKKEAEKKEEEKREQERKEADRRAKEDKKAKDDADRLAREESEKAEKVKADRAAEFLAKSKAKEEANRKALADKIDASESLVFFDSQISGEKTPEMALKAVGMKNPHLRRMQDGRRASVSRVVPIEVDSDEALSSDEEGQLALNGPSSKIEEGASQTGSRISGVADEAADGQALERTSKSEQQNNDDKELEDLLGNPFVGGNKIRIKLKNFEDSSSDDENVVASGDSKRLKETRSSGAPKAAGGGGGGGLLAKPPAGGGALSAAPGAGSRRRKPLQSAEKSNEAAVVDPLASAAKTEQPSADAFGASFAFPPADAFGSAFPPADSFGSGFPASEAKVAPVPAPAPAPASSESASVAASFPDSFVPSFPDSGAAFGSFPPPDNFVASFPPAENFVASFPPADSFVASFPAAVESSANSNNDESTKAARPLPPATVPQPPPPRSAGSVEAAKSQERVPVAELKEIFSNSSAKARRFPALPEEELFADRHSVTTSLRCTEMIGGAIHLLDVKTVRLFLQVGLNPESQVEESHESWGRPLLVAGRTWLNLRRESQGAEEVKVVWKHTLGSVNRVAQIKEIVAICKLLLLKGAVVSPDILSIAQELKGAFGDSRFLELVTGFPTRNELESILTFPPAPKTEEESVVRSHLTKTAETLKTEHAKSTDPRIAAEAEKEYAKKLKKLPRAVVKKHLNNRIKPLLSPLLRPAEQCFCVCAVFDVIGVLNYVNRKGANVNEQIEAWGAGIKHRMTPLEVMCKFWVHSDGVETRKVLVFFVEYSRDVAESDCIEALSALLQSGAEVTQLAKELALDKGPLLKTLLEEKKIPKQALKKKEDSAADAATSPAPAAAEATEEPKRKFKFGKDKGEGKEKKERSKLTFGRSKTVPIEAGGEKAKGGRPTAAAAVGAADDESGSSD